MDRAFRENTVNLPEPMAIAAAMGKGREVYPPGNEAPFPSNLELMEQCPEWKVARGLCSR